MREVLTFNKEPVVRGRPYQAHAMYAPGEVGEGGLATVLGSFGSFERAVDAIVERLRAQYRDSTSVCNRGWVRVRGVGEIWVTIGSDGEPWLSVRDRRARANPMGFVS